MICGARRTTSTTSAVSALGMRSAMSVPMTVRGDTVGACQPS